MRADKNGRAKAFLSALFSAFLLASTAAAAPLQDVPYKFDPEKLKSAKDTFHFLRTFVDYFYLVAKANREQLKAVAKTWGAAGWCAGDAHPENFGALLLGDGTPVFTINDMDDAGPCPVVLDVFRLMVSAHLLDNDTTGKKILDAYVEGLRGHSFEAPSAVKDLLAKSKRQGTAVSPKNLNGDKLARNPDSRELSRQELDQVTRALAPFGPALGGAPDIADTFATEKESGGSFGLLRYEVLLRTPGGLLQMELKEETKPAIYPVANGTLPETGKRIETTIKIEMGENASKLYGVVAIGDKAMLARPRFDGNNGVKLGGSGGDNDTIQFEAYTLGLLHARSLGAGAGKLADEIGSVPDADWIDDVDRMAKRFKDTYSN